MPQVKRVSIFALAEKIRKAVEYYYVEEDEMEVMRYTHFLCMVKIDRSIPFALISKETHEAMSYLRMCIFSDRLKAPQKSAGKGYHSEVKN